MVKSMLSVVVPTFNSETRISEIVENICRNIPVDFEVIIVDDCSTDSTKDIIFDLSQRYENIRCIYLDKNSGPGIARDIAFKTVDSEFVLFFDDDDFLYGENIEEILQKMNIYQLDVAVMAYEYADSLESDGQGTMLSGDEARFSSILRCDQASIIQPSVFPSILSIVNFPWNKICRTDYLRKIGAVFGVLRLHEDVPIHWNILCNTDYVYLTRRLIGRHVVDQGVRNATRQIHTSRMQVLDALQAAYDYVNRSVNRKEFIVEFYRFQVDLIRWASDYVPSNDKVIYSQRASALFKNISISDLNMVFHKNRNLYHSINHYIKNH